MKIALVLMPWYRRESPSPELAMAVSMLRKENHEVAVFDINNSLFNDEFLLRRYWKFFLLDAPPDMENEFFSSVKNIFDYYASQMLTSSDVIIFKITGKTFSNSVNLAKIIKEKNKQKTVIFSGALVSDKEDINSIIRAQNELPFDYIICGEDDIALPALISSLENNIPITLNLNGKVIDCLNGPIIEDFDFLPFYDFSDSNLKSFKFPEKLEIFISRGCPWSCSFCVDWLNEKKYRAMSGERIYREVLHQIKTKRIRHLRFCDKTINGDIKAINDFCDLVISSSNQELSSMEWSGDAMIRPEMTKDLLLKMRQSGCGGLGYGLESGSDKVLRGMNKHFSAAIAAEVIKNTHDSGIFTSVNIMVGFPTEALSDFLETLSFIERNQKSIDEIRLTFIGCRITKYSILYNFPERFNISDVDTDNWSTRDGLNTLDERVRRYELICQHILDLGISLRVNSRTTKKLVKAG